MVGGILQESSVICSRKLAITPKLGIVQDFIIAAIANAMQSQQ